MSVRPPVPVYGLDDIGLLRKRLAFYTYAQPAMRDILALRERRLHATVIQAESAVRDFHAANVDK